MRIPFLHHPGACDALVLCLAASAGSETKEQAARTALVISSPQTLSRWESGFKTGRRKNQLQCAPSNNTLCRVSPVGTGTSSHVAA